MANSAVNVASEDVSKRAGGEATSYTLSPALVTFDPHANSQSEGFRALRTRIMARHVEEGRRALVVCAATAGVGCTFVAANLSLALSQIGVKALLIDANMRTPGIDNFADYIQHEVLPNLSILFAGDTPAHPQELLATNRFADLMSYCLRDYDLTVIDTPPASTCADVHRVSTVAGYSLVVARRDTTLVADVRTLVRQLESDHARIVGTVMTEG
jgi:protein-tyrosine kinase